MRTLRMLVVPVVALCVMAAPAAATGQADAGRKAGAVAAAAGGGQLKSYATLQEYEKATGKKISAFSESPVLKSKVAAGTLPPVEKRLPEEPLVVQPKNEIGRYGGTFRVGSINPGAGGTDEYLSRCQPLVILTPDLKSIVPNIAKGWSFSENNSVFTLYLRKGMKWSDGAPFTADDFVFWYEDILLNDELTPVKPRDWAPGGKLVKVDKIDETTVRFTFGGPYPVILDQLAITVEQVNRYPFQPKHYLKKFHPKYNPNADAEAKQAGFDSWWKWFGANWVMAQNERKPGYPEINPWVPAKTDAAGNRTYERNPYYWKVDTAGNQLPYADTQIRMIVESTELWNLKVIAGEYDYAAQHTSVDTYPVFKENEAKGGYHAMIWQFDRGVEMVNFKFNQTIEDPVQRVIFRDLRFRQAFSLAINRAEINKVIFNGRAIARQGAVVPSVSFYEPAMGEHYAQYDPEESKRLLDEMGLKYDKEGKVRLRPDGRPLVITVEFAQYAGPRTKMLELIKETIEAVGIQVALKQIDQGLYAQRANAGALETTMWNLDATTEIGYHRNPLAFLPYATAWTLWLNTGGKSGEEPTKEVKDYFALSEKFMQVPLGSEEYTKIGKELVWMSLNNLWNIGVVGQIPKPVIFKTSLGNTPGEEATYSWDYRFFVPFQADQWYFKK